MANLPKGKEQTRLAWVCSLPDNIDYLFFGVKAYARKRLSLSALHVHYLAEGVKDLYQVLGLLHHQVDVLVCAGQLV